MLILSVGLTSLGGSYDSVSPSRTLIYLLKSIVSVTSKVCLSGSLPSMVLKISEWRNEWMNEWMNGGLIWSSVISTFLRYDVLVNLPTFSTLPLPNWRNYPSSVFQEHISLPHRRFNLIRTCCALCLLAPLSIICAPCASWLRFIYLRIPRLVGTNRLSVMLTLQFSKL